MSVYLSRAALGEVADRAHLPNIRQDMDRTFELPTRIYAATAGLYLAFLAVMAIGFQTPEMILPMAIFVIFMVMAFGVPLLWVRMKPHHNSKAIDWVEFVQTGIETHTGRMTSVDAVGQVLVLPVLIFLWGVATATIAAIVS